MVKLNLEGDNDKISTLLDNLKEHNFYFSRVEHAGDNPDNSTYIISETPGSIPDEEEFGYRGFIAQWIRAGLKSSLKDFLFLSEKGTMVSFENMIEFKKISDFLTVNFGPDMEITELFTKVSENNFNNFQNSPLIVYGRDSWDDEDY